VKLYSRNSRDLADRFSMLRDACLYLPDCVIDGELVACDTDGRPDFSAITRDHANLCIWCFDLLAHEQQDMREKPLVERKAALRDLLIVVDYDRLRYSEEFAAPMKLLQLAARMGLEGIVSERKQAPYRSCARREWVKVFVWREANKDRWEMFEKKGRKTSV
jgi:bifunctional non-homologous end joining protein LigD